LNGDKEYLKEEKKAHKGIEKGSKNKQIYTAATLWTAR
jgi:hypothetical protein